jgi:biopolymer transport protein ExbD
MKGMKVNLPTGISGQTQTKREYVSSLGRQDGQIYFDKTPMEPDVVYNSLVEVHKAAPHAKIFIRGDRDTTTAIFIRLIEQVRSARFLQDRLRNQESVFTQQQRNQ